MSRGGGQRIRWLDFSRRTPLDAVKVKSFFQKALLLCCALYLSGAHWMILQTAAWTGMLVSRAQQGSVAEAVETTFDGEHPCRMCSAIETGQKKEQEQEREFPALKKIQELKFVEVARTEVPVRESGEVLCWREFAQAGIVRADAPLTPPPRV